MGVQIATMMATVLAVFIQTKSRLGIETQANTQRNLSQLRTAGTLGKSAMVAGGKL
jgi:hypothetical protein